jgi:hypothetical protein
VARRPDLEETLERLKLIRDDPAGSDALATLREILAGRLSHAIAKACEIAADAQLHDLVPALVAAFERFMKEPAKRDPGCRAKTAIVDALQHLDASEGDLYLRAARHVQLEAVWGGKEDTAAALRGAAGRGLVRMNHPNALLVLADLLADPEVPARIAAARTIAYHGGSAGLPLLRLKVLTGDREIDVLGDCLLGMLQISAPDSIDFISRLLDGELAEAALLALGESRAKEALAVLQAYWERTVDADLSRSALLGVAMLRSEEALDWLLSLIASEPGPIARDAIGAFEIYRNDERLVERVRKTVRERSDLDLTGKLNETLP